MQKIWKDIKDQYQTWPMVNEYYHKSPDRFYISIGDRAKIGDWAKVGNWAEIGDSAEIEDSAKIGNWAKVGRQLTYIMGSMHQVYLYDPKKKMIGIGCVVMTIDGWQKNYKAIGKYHGYTDYQIEEYKRYIDLFHQNL